MAETPKNNRPTKRNYVERNPENNDSSDKITKKIVEEGQLLRNTGKNSIKSLREAMANANSDSVVKQIISEGVLLRNKGENSIKSLKGIMEKCNVHLGSISDKLGDQTNYMKNMLNEMYVEGDIRRQREEADRIRISEEREKGEEVNPTPVSQTKVVKGDTSISGLMGMFGGLGLALLSIPIRAMTSMVSLLGSDMLIEYIVDQAVGSGVPIDFVKAIAEPLKSGAFWGSLGLLISKRFGLYGLVAGSAWSMAEEIVDAAGLSSATLMGLGLDDIFGAILSGSALYVTRSLLSPSVAGMAGSGIAGSILSNKGFLSAKSKLGIGILGLASAMMLAYSDEISKSVADVTGMSDESAAAATDVAGAAMTGASIGLMFGPKGALVGAALGFAYGIGVKIVGYINDSERLAKQRMDKLVALEDVLNDNGSSRAFSDYEINSLEQEARESGDEDMLKRIAEVRSKNNIRKGGTGSEISEASLEEYKQQLSKDAETYRNDLEKIASDESLSVEDRQLATLDYIKKIRSAKYSNLTEREVADVLASSISDASWGSDWDANDMLSVLRESGAIDKQTINGSEVSMRDLMSKVSEKFQNVNGETFDPSNIEHMKWVQNDAEARGWLNTAARGLEGIVGPYITNMSGTSVGPNGEKLTEKDIAARSGIEAAANTHKLMKLQKYLQDNAIDTLANSLNASKNASVVTMGGTNVITNNISHHNVDSSTNISGGRGRGRGGNGAIRN